jgi:hypothetical protein
MWTRINKKPLGVRGLRPLVARLSLIVPVYRAGITTLLAKAGLVSASPGQIPPRFSRYMSIRLLQRHEWINLKKLTNLPWLHNWANPVSEVFYAASTSISFKPGKWTLRIPCQHRELYLALSGPEEGDVRNPCP